MNRGLFTVDEEHEDGDVAQAEEQAAAEPPAAQDADAEKTVVIPALRKDDAAKPVPHTAPAAPVAPPKSAAPEDTSVATRRVPSIPPAPGPVPAPPTGPLQIVRKQGYDSAAVDQRLQMLATDRAELTAAIAQHETRSAELEKALDTLLSQLDETKSPSYAGLGGRASAMLRLAEEEAAEMRTVAQSDAEEIRAQAARDAQDIKAEATREAEDMRIVQLKELDETRTQVLTDAEQTRSLAQSEASDLVASATRESEQLRPATQPDTTELRTGAPLARPVQPGGPPGCRIRRNRTGTAAGRRPWRRSLARQVPSNSCRATGRAKLSIECTESHTQANMSDPKSTDTQPQGLDTQPQDLDPNTDGGLPQGPQTTAIARQAIVDDKGKVFGYEQFDGTRASSKHNAASDAQLLFNVRSHADPRALVYNRAMFINCTTGSLAGCHLEMGQTAL